MIIIGVNTEKNNFKINSKIQCIQIEISRKYRKEQLVETLGAFENVIEKCIILFKGDMNKKDD